MGAPQRRELGKVPNEGARLLWVALKRHGWTAYRLAREMGLAPGAPVWRWLYCDQKPAPPQRAWIQDHLKIGWRTWDEDPTAEVLPRDAA